MADTKGATEVIIAVMEKMGYTPSVLGKRIGVSPTAVWDRLHGSRKTKERKSTDLKVSTMAAMLRGMDYKLVAVPGSKAVKDGEYELK